MSSAVEVAARARSHHYADDMNGDAGDEPAVEPLRSAVAFLRETTDVPFRVADRAAIRQQRRHHLTATLAAVFGTIAVVSTVSAPAVPQNVPAGAGVASAADVLHVVAAVAAVISLAVGLVFAFQRQWLLERHKAERLRLLKYRELLDITLAFREPSDLLPWKERVRGRVDQIARIDGDAVEMWLEEEQDSGADTVPPTFGSNRETAGYLQTFVAYYSEKRLSCQLLYLWKKWKGATRWDIATQSPMTILFFLSIVLAAAASGVHLLSGDQQLEVSLTTLAAVLPALAAGLRTFRSMNEFGRNSIRFRAKYLALKLAQDRMRSDQQPEQTVRDLWYAEQILAMEHREWLRLMIDADWFG